MTNILCRSHRKLNNHLEVKHFTGKCIISNIFNSELVFYQNAEGPTCTWVVYILYLNISHYRIEVGSQHYLAQTVYCSWTHLTKCSGILLFYNSVGRFITIFVKIFTQNSIKILDRIYTLRVNRMYKG